MPQCIFEGVANISLVSVSRPWNSLWLSGRGCWLSVLKCVSVCTTGKAEPGPELKLPKALLQQHCQKLGWGPPRFEKLALGGGRLPHASLRYSVNLEPTPAGKVTHCCMQTLHSNDVTLDPQYDAVHVIYHNGLCLLHHSFPGDTCACTSRGVDTVPQAQMGLCYVSAALVPGTKTAIRTHIDMSMNAKRHDFQ